MHILLCFRTAIENIDSQCYFRLLHHLLPGLILNRLLIIVYHKLLRSHTANLGFYPMAFAYVTRPLINPDGQGVASYVTSYNGISLRVTKGYDQQYKRSIYSMDVLYGFKTIYPELAVRVLG